jgi:hypothetical protein
MNRGLVLRNHARFFHSPRFLVLSCDPERCKRIEEKPFIL